MSQNFTIRHARPGEDEARVALLAPSHETNAAGLAAQAAGIRRRFRDFGDLAPGIIRLVAEDANGAILGALEATVRLYANGYEGVGVMFLESIAVPPACREPRHYRCPARAARGCRQRGPHCQNRVRFMN